MQTNKLGRSRWNYIFIALTAAVMIWLLSQMQDPEQVLNTLRAADVRYMLAAVGCMVVFWWLESVLLRQISHSFGQRLTRAASFRVSMIGQLFNNITPFASGGQPVQAYELARYGVGYGESSCILLVKFVIYQLAMTLYALVVTFIEYRFFSSRIPGFGLIIAVGFLTNIVALSMITAVGFFPTATRRGLSALVKLAARLHLARHPEELQRRVTAELDMFYVNFQHMRSRPQIIITPLLVTLAQMTVYFTIPFLIFRSLGIDNVEYAQVFSATLFVFMVTSFIPAPGASGGAEGSFYWFLSIFIGNADLLLMTTVLWRVITFYLPMGVGACFYFTRKRARPHIKPLTRPARESSRSPRNDSSPE